MKLTKILTLAGLGMIALGCYGVSDFLRASANGAYADIGVIVLDESNRPIQDAIVDFRFGMLDEKRSTNKSVSTDANGCVSASGLTCGHYVRIKTSHPDYYPSSKSLCFVAMGEEHGVKNGHWLPEKMTCTIRMRKIRNPVNLDSKAYTLFFPSTNEWFGVDLLVGDWVAPNGKGMTSDVEFFYSWEGEEPKKRTNENLKLRFSESPNGGTKMPVIEECSHAQSYGASTDFLCVQSFSSTNTSYWDGHMTEKDSDFTFRIRSVTNSVGEIVSCNYGRFKNIEYGIQPNRIAVVVLSYEINPKSLDNNLERKK